MSLAGLLWRMYRSHPIRGRGSEEHESDDEDADLRTISQAKQAPATVRATREFASRYSSIASAAGPTAPYTPHAVLPLGRVVTRHTSPTQYTLALLNERAKLLDELAHLKRAASINPRA